MSVALQELPGTRRVEQIMGLPIVVDVRDEDEAGAALDELFDWLRRVDATFSTFKEDSEISRINRGGLRREDAQPQVRQVLERCELLRHETGGFVLFSRERENDEKFLLESGSGWPHVENGGNRG